jgi:hypothetical protein
MEQPESLGIHLGEIEIYAKRERCNSGLAFGGNDPNNILLVPASGVIAERLERRLERQSGADQKRQLT